MNIHSTNKDFSTPAYKYGILQGKSYRVLQNNLAGVLSPFNLSISEWKLISLVFEHKKIRVAHLAEALSVDPPLITKLVTGLEKKQLVNKVQDSIDKRVTFITANKKLEALLPQVEIYVKKDIRRLFAGIAPQEFLIYIKVLQTVIDQDNSSSSKYTSLTDS